MKPRAFMVLSITVAPMAKARISFKHAPVKHSRLAYDIVILPGNRRA